MSKEPKILQRALDAADNMDWEQATGNWIGNGGPPCFYLARGDDRFCGRAERWAGHTDKNDYPEHRFVSLGALLREHGELSSKELRNLFRGLRNDAETVERAERAARIETARKCADIVHAAYPKFDAPPGLLNTIGARILAYAASLEEGKE